MQEKSEAVKGNQAEAGHRRTVQSVQSGKRKPGFNSLQTLILHIIIITVILWFMFGFVLGARYAPNNDMSPAVHTGDLLFFYRLDKDYRAQDIVIVRKNDTDYVGRIIGAPGDSIDITDSEELVINGNAVSESDIHASTPRLEGFVNYPVYLGRGEYFVLADARSGAEDSRYYGVVTDRDIAGGVILLIRRDSL